MTTPYVREIVSHSADSGIPDDFGFSEVESELGRDESLSSRRASRRTNAKQRSALRRALSRVEREACSLAGIRADLRREGLL